MNKTYIKRQLTLNKLGFPLDIKVQEYVDYFNELIGSSKSLKKEYGRIYREKGYLYIKNDIRLLFYEIKSKVLYVDFNHIWIKFMVRFDINDKEVGNFLSVILEKILKHNVRVIVQIGTVDPTILETHFIND